MQSAASKELHLLKVQVEVQNINISVKFPCSLKVTLKSQQESAVCTQAYPLEEGVCQINEPLEVQAEVVYDSKVKKYQASSNPISLLAVIASSNTNIPAGSALLSLFEGENDSGNSAFSEWTQSTETLQKCSDRQAKIFFKHRWNFVRKIRDIEEQTANFRSSRAAQHNAQFKGSSYRREGSNSKDKNFDENSISESRVRAHNLPPRTGHRERIKTNVSASYQQYNMEANIRKENALKSEVEMLTLQVQKYKDKCRSYERKERELNLTIKDLKENIERKKSKFVESESAKANVEMMLSEKEKAIKDYKIENKKLNDAVQDLRIQSHTLQKKILVKEKSFEEQLKFYTDKVSQVERESQKVTYEYNALLEQMEATEKGNQLNSKEKEKAHMEEKTRLIKKIEHLSQEIEKLKEAGEDKDSKISSLQSGSRNLGEQSSQRQQELDRLESEFEYLKTELKNEKERTQNLERELHSLSSVESDRNALKKKHNETLQELSKLSEKHTRLKSAHSDLEKSFEEVSSSLKELGKTHKQLNHQHSSLANDHEALRKEHSSLSSEFNSLSARSQNNTQKMNDLKTKLDSEKEEYEAMQAHYEDKLNYLSKLKEYADAEVEDSREKYEKLEQLQEALEKKCKELNAGVLEKHEQSMKLEEKLSKQEDRIRDLQAIEAEKEQQIEQYQRKERELMESLKAKGNDSYNLQKKIGEQQQEIFVLGESIQSLEKRLQESQDDLSRQIGDRDAQIIGKDSKLEENKATIQNLIGDLERLTEDLSESSREVESLTDQIKAKEEELEAGSVANAQLTKEITELKGRCEELEAKIQEGRGQNKELAEKQGELSKRWKDYREQTSKALEQLVDAVSKDEIQLTSTEEEGSQVELLKFPDANLSEMQIVALRSRNEIIAKYRENLSAASEEIEFLKMEGDKAKQQFEQKEKLLEKEILTLKEAHSKAVGELTQERNELKFQIDGKEEKIQSHLSEIERQKSVVQNLEEIISEVNAEKGLLEEELDNEQREVALLEEQILELKANEIKEKSSKESSYKEEKELLEAQIASLKRTLQENGQKLLANQTQIQEQESKITAVENELQESQGKLRKQASRKKQADEKVSELEKERDRLRADLKGREKAISELQAEQESLASENCSLDSKLAALTKEHKQSLQELTEISVKNEKLEEEIGHLSEDLSKLRDHLSSTESRAAETEGESEQRIQEQLELINRLESSVELKDFEIGKLQSANQKREEEIKGLEKELEEKKGSLAQTQDQVIDLKNALLKVEESSGNYCSELQQAREESSLNTETIVELESEIELLKPKAEELTIRLEELASLRRAMAELEGEKQQLSLELKSVQSEAKNTSSKLSSKEEEYRKKVLSLEATIESKEIELSANAQQMGADLEREKASLMKELEAQDEAIRNMEQESKFRIDQLEGEIETLNQDCLELSNLLAEKEDDLVALEEQNAESERKITDLSNELKACLEAWDKEKAAYLPSRKQMTELQSEMGKFQDYASELDSKTRELLEVSRKKGGEESKFGLSQVLRELNSTISKSKTKVLGRADSEEEKQGILEEYSHLEDKIESAMRSQNILYK